ncbi:adenylyltransferase/cytidyltransferase family protein [Demequina sediminis]|uniref:adenylyltransferase/cytidyltransferase family protein n=1 Tax=Demequina sediminis TaxID=1930058 RepID=UPI003305A6B5
MTTAVFPGTFDPVTWGHVDIATRARSMFSRVVIAVAHNSTKTPCSTSTPAWSSRGARSPRSRGSRWSRSTGCSWTSARESARA